MMEHFREKRRMKGEAELKKKQRVTRAFRLESRTLREFLSSIHPVGFLLLNHF